MDGSKSPVYLSLDSFSHANANLILSSCPSRTKLSTCNLPEGKADGVALLLVVEAADVVDVEEELAEVAEEEGEDEQHEDARQLGLAPRRRRGHGGRVRVLQRQIEVGYGPLIKTFKIGGWHPKSDKLNLKHASSSELVTTEIVSDIGELSGEVKRLSHSLSLSINFGNGPRRSLVPRATAGAPWWVNKDKCEQTCRITPDMSRGNDNAQADPRREPL